MDYWTDSAQANFQEAIGGELDLLTRRRIYAKRTNLVPPPPGMYPSGSAGATGLQSPNFLPDGIPRGVTCLHSATA